jgi:Protein of unknown function (DUF3618)
MSKSSAQLEKEAQETRSELAATLDELRSRISPGQLLDQSLDFARESNAGEFVRNLGRDARDNPLPLALIGAGIAWLMMTNSRRRDGFDAAHADAALAAAGALPESSAASAPAVSHDAAAKGGSFLAFCREHPLVLGGIGLTVGALIGAALPSSETESHFVSAASDERGGHFSDDSSVAEASVVPAPAGEHVEF